MKPRYSFSSRRTGQAKDPKNYLKQKAKFPEVVKRVLREADIILQVLDSRFPEDTRNPEVEQEIEKKGKILLNVINKMDLNANAKNLPLPNSKISCKERKGIRKLREKIKIISSKIKKQKIVVGVIGYPNTGKSSLINILIGKKSAPSSSNAGYTKGVQKLKLSENVLLLDSPGIIPKREYTSVVDKKIARHAKVGARTYTQVRDPEAIIAILFKEYALAFQKHFKIKTKSVEHLIEKIGRQKNFLKKGNKVNYDQTSRFILKEWQDSKIKIN